MDLAGSKRDLNNIEVISPDEQDMVVSLDRNKTVANLKELLAGHYYQFVG